MTVSDTHADTICPDCKGAKGHLGPVDCVAPYEHEETDDCGCPRAWLPCWTCEGSGELKGLRRATYFARGGPPPVPFRGHA